MPKPATRKKKFIDKKREETVTFSLIHRSQKDPLAADDDAPQMVLLPTSSTNPEDLAKVKEEEREHGVFYEDDYNYMQHMKDLSKPEYDYSEVDRFLLQRDVRQESHSKAAAPASVSKLQLPNDVLASTDRDGEAEVGLLNLAAPRSGPLLDWDPDIVETLDDAFEGAEVYTAKQLERELELEGEEGEDGDDELDELFKEALAEREYDDDDDDDDEYEDCEDEEQDFDSDFGGRSSDEEDDEVPDLLDARGHRLFMEEETKSRFTEYSMSSSVIRRNQQLSMLDDRFENFFAGYDDMNVGGLEADDIEGSREVRRLDGDATGEVVMKQVLNEFQREKALERQQMEQQEKVIAAAAAAAAEGDGNKNADKEIMEMFEDKPKDRFDCQSILSTYSTLYNHPKLISEKSKKPDLIRISGKTGMPKDVLGRTGLTEGMLKRLDRQNETEAAVGSGDSDEGSDGGQTLASRMSALSFRNRHETPEERKARKNAMKEIKRERRVEKKANRAAFKDEQKRQEKVMGANRQNTLKIL